MINRMQTGIFLAELRRERGLTQEKLAEKLHVSGKTVSRWETGQTLPDYEQMQTLCEIYSVRLEEILAGKRTEPSEQGTGAHVKEAAGADVKQSQKKRQYTGWIIGIAGIAASCVLLVVLLASKCGKPDRIQTAAQDTDAPLTVSSETGKAADSTPAPRKTPEATATASPQQTNCVKIDIPEQLFERQLTDEDLILLQYAPPEVLRQRICTAGDMLAWFSVTDPEIWDSNSIHNSGTTRFYYQTPQEQLKKRFFAADSLAIPGAWLIQDDYEGLCVLYVNGVNCLSNMWIGIPCGGGWCVFDPAAYTSHGGHNGALDCVTVEELSDLYSVLDAFNAAHPEHLTPISRIDDLEQEVAYYDNNVDKSLSEETGATVIPR